MQKNIFPSYVAQRELPDNIIPGDEYLFARELSKKIPSTDIVFLNGAFILNDSIFAPGQFKFFSRFTHPRGFAGRQKFNRIRMLWGHDQQNVDFGVWIIDNWSAGYFHWFTDALSRWIVAKEYLNVHTVLLPDFYNEIPFVKESLELLKIPCKFYDPTKKLLVKNLVVPEHCAPTGNYNKEIINSLREQFEKAAKAKTYRKIYISRQKASKRKILNENAITKLVLSYGFEIHCFEDYNLEKQIELMNESSHLIGLHGAGLTNMLFMPKGGKVLELRNHNDFQNNCYFSLASDLGHRYYYLLNKGNSFNTHEVNIRVNIDEFKRVMEGFLD